jgi:NADPH2:quinone reductase
MPPGGNAVDKNTIRAVVVDPAVEGRLAIKEVPAPSPTPSEALVRVKAISLNLGETRNALTEAPAGWRPGWDFAGVVEKAAADGSGPKAGTRVVGMMFQGSWAEFLAVPNGFLAALPDSVSFAQAATLPVAGLTALYGLERNGSIRDRKVLITGASGGVGLFGCQIARDQGAHVFALVRRPEREKHAREAGAHDVAIGEDATPAAKFGPYHTILESVGGTVVAQALTMLAPNGMCVSVGVSAASQATVDVRALMRAGGVSWYGFYLGYEFQRESASSGLGRLVKMMTEGHLKAPIDLEAPWEQVAQVATRLYRDRGIVGKAVLAL